MANQSVGKLATKIFLVCVVIQIVGWYLADVGNPISRGRDGLAFALLLGSFIIGLGSGLLCLSSLIDFIGEKAAKRRARLAARD